MDKPNYILEINKFYDWLETNPLSKSAISLWTALMHINNKSDWKDKFTVATSVLEYKTGFKKSELFKARNELTQKNRIIWNTRGGNLSAEYEMIFFCFHNTDTNSNANSNASRNANSNANGSQMVTINKLNKNKTKLNKTKLSKSHSETDVSVIEKIENLKIENDFEKLWNSFNGKRNSLEKDFKNFEQKTQGLKVDFEKLIVEAKKNQEEIYFQSWLNKYFPKSTIKVPQKKESGGDQFFKQFVAVWFEFYESKFSFKPTFGAVDGSKTKSIIAKLKAKATEKGFDWNLETLENSSRKLFELAYSNKWLSENFRLSVIDSQFDSIIAKTVKNGQQNNSTAVNDILANWQ